MDHLRVQIERARGLLNAEERQLSRFRHQALIDFLKSWIADMKEELRIMMDDVNEGGAAER